ncbi:MAG: hypothetical protein M3170_12505, partial [Candidatus Dormibacteraeota bacterium]|nr:hypothetical protein [Candidatus Dormibacteraeota bacterium]
MESAAEGQAASARRQDQRAGDQEESRQRPAGEYAPATAQQQRQPPGQAQHHDAVQLSVSDQQHQRHAGDRAQRPHRLTPAGDQQQPGQQGQHLGDDPEASARAEAELGEGSRIESDPRRRHDGQQTSVPGQVVGPRPHHSPLLAALGVTIVDSVGLRGGQPAGDHERRPVGVLQTLVAAQQSQADDEQAGSHQQALGEAPPGR